MTQPVSIMFLRIDAPRRQRRELLALLQSRGTDVQEARDQRDRVVIRGEVDVTQVFELRRQVEALTGGSAQFLSWLLLPRAPVRVQQGVPA